MARLELEAKTGKMVVTAINAKDALLGVKKKDGLNHEKGEKE